MNAKLEEAEKNRAEDEEKYQKIKKEHEDQLEKMARESSAKHGPGLFNEICDIASMIPIPGLGLGAQLVKKIFS